MNSTTISVKRETGDHFRDLRDRVDAFGSDDLLRRLMLEYERNQPDPDSPGGTVERGLRL